ncbi:MAG: glucose-6-phosphate isomerase [Paracoccaceae bacterium]|nr:glucose-6-phosphate isomerase [Paracoccaceae bacterium]
MSGAVEMAWAALKAEAARLDATTLSTLFEADPDRFDRFSAEGAGLMMDFSKEKIDRAALEALIALARAARVEARRDAMCAGEAINTTEGRAVLHMALRGGAGSEAAAETETAAAERDRFLSYAEEVRRSGVADVIAIGIGGSSLGPEMATKALAPWHDGPRVHFVSNVDGAHLGDVLKRCDPARTLVIATSKTFTTEETMANARAARDWLGASAGGRMAAVTAATDKAAEFGIPPERCFAMWDWIGGRYSVWSAVGLPLAIAVGAGAFRAFLDGARAMDLHFREAPLQRNLPVLMALIGIWRRNGMGCGSYALIPYDARLSRLSAWLQQLEMESNGKRVGLDGELLARATAPVVWGEPGSDAQHSFFQLLHQGTDVIPVDFILAAEPVDGLPGHHARLTANALAQAAALAFGTPEGTEAHRVCPGDRPSTMLLARRMDPATLGAVLALMEHKVFVQGTIWGINPFDQWGVELGKVLARDVLERIESDVMEGLDGSTAGLLRSVRDYGAS